MIHLGTDLACVHRWISDNLSGKTRVRIKAVSEMLIRRRLITLRKLTSEYGLVLDKTLIKFHESRADKLNRVSQRWLDEIQKKTEPIELAYDATSNELESARIRNIYQISGHPT